MTRPYFAYGSNMDKEQMGSRCPDATLVGQASLETYRFALDSRGAASIVSAGSSTAYGLLWSISEACEATLDRYEGVSAGVYVKVSLEVLDLAQQREMNALVYVGRDSSPGSPRDTTYMQRILAAAMEHDLPNHYIEELRTWLPTGG